MTHGGECEKMKVLLNDGLEKEGVRLFEEFGIEDARITKLDEPILIDNKTYEYIITYVACSEDYDVCTAFCATNDFKNFIILNPVIICPI
jgi:predicted GH43/DUF377 family glycosyl hydrolase